MVRQTSEFLAAEMASPEGGFWSAIDAETGGREGAYYVWTRDDLKEVLREEDYGFLAPLFGFSGPGTLALSQYVIDNGDEFWNLDDVATGSDPHSVGKIGAYVCKIQLPTDLDHENFESMDHYRGLQIDVEKLPTEIAQT